MTKSHATINVSLITVIWGIFLTGFTRYCDRDHKRIEVNVALCDNTQRFHQLKTLKSLLKFDSIGIFLL